MIPFGLIAGIANILRQNAEFEASMAHAREAVSQEVIDACLEWGRTTIIPNSTAFDICWRAGGPAQAEYDPGYRICVLDQWRRMR
jgi:hypothetical protein